VRNATRILVFDQGYIVESGNFDDLIRLNGRFAELARAQFMVPIDPPVPANAKVIAAEPARKVRARRAKSAN